MNGIGKKFLAFVVLSSQLTLLGVLNPSSVAVVVGGLVAGFAAYTGTQAHVDATEHKAARSPKVSTEASS